MASLSAQQQHELALSAAYEDDTPTPIGWRRKLIPHIGKGLVPARTDVVFIAPNGEEFKTKAQLQRYLKSHKRSPSLSEFIWTTDETLRRSSRSVSKCSKSPPKTLSRKKPPLEESKATKRRHTENTDDMYKPKGDKKRHHKETPFESTGDTEGSPTWSSARDSENTPSKVTEGRKNAKASTQSPEVSSKAHVSKNSADVCEHENGEGEETMKENESGKEESMDEPISDETILEEDAKTKIVCVQEQEAIEEHISDEAMKEDGRKSENFQIKERNLHNGHDNVCMDDQECSKDGTTMSLLGSDFSTDGMEADSDMFESGKIVEEEAIHHATKDQSENTVEDSKKDTAMCPENGLSEAVK